MMVYLILDSPVLTGDVIRYSTITVYAVDWVVKFWGPSCSKLTMSLVNISVKCWSLNMAYTLICFAEKNVSSFCKCKSYSHFFSAKIPVN